MLSGLVACSWRSSDASMCVTVPDSMALSKRSNLSRSSCQFSELTTVSTYHNGFSGLKRSRRTSPSIMWALSFNRI